jgi:hypothetical protein
MGIPAVAVICNEGTTVELLEYRGPDEAVTRQVVVKLNAAVELGWSTDKLLQMAMTRLSAMLLHLEDLRADVDALAGNPSRQIIEAKWRERSEQLDARIAAEDAREA